VSNLELYRIDHEQGQLLVNGQASSEQDVMQFVRNLQNSGVFSEVTITTLTRNIASDNGTDTVNYSYSLAIKLGRGQ
jgi:Tfp pilus assembly protein PilN